MINIEEMKVDVGNEIRTLVAGIKQNYSKEELIGKYVVVLVNLEPKKLRGIESEGTLLAADDGEEVSLLTIDKEIKIGAKVVYIIIIIHSFQEVLCIFVFFLHNVFSANFIFQVHNQCCLYCLKNWWCSRLFPCLDIF